MSAGEVPLPDGRMGCFVCKPGDSGFSPNLHVRVGNPHYPSMTEAMRNRIVTRRLREDGRVLPDKRWRGQ